MAHRPSLSVLQGRLKVSEKPEKGIYIYQAPNKKDERMIPSIFLPYIVFSPQAPYTLATARSLSELPRNLSSN
jgi:hypothetical protein